MKAVKEGQIVKFHTPLAHEKPNQLYVVLEVITDQERSRAEIQALNTGLPFPPINKVKLTDLEVVEVETDDLMGQKVTINKSDFSQVEGIVIKVSEQKMEVNMSNSINGIETNVWLTILDRNGDEHAGTLLVIPE
ncbi:hypothetical protein B0A79_22525 [Flavobacterium piscis]|uniref:Uncharacterized protein n=1 Tax=Flavobacterium piscis TaxID=1114874 RepID=A0ABX2XFI3_9FLAO|nr:hypothetical protein [Flavobacterium piscis]OCB71172.1 hypothetical protein FLP_16810 [Flavobacterium piscis]OXE96611.1 hypothetical protein B0A79_22525 [Flavobacterium piscis]